MTTSAVRTVEHQIAIDAPPTRVYQLIADVRQWPEIFPPTVHAAREACEGNSELIRIWATANGTAKTWTSRRQLDEDELSIAFRQERSQHQVGGMGGRWVVEPSAGSGCLVRLLHDYFAANDDTADLDWIGQAVDRNSAAELNALKASAELSDPQRLVTFDDTVEVDGNAEDVYDFLNDAQLWAERLPHVARVQLDEETIALFIRVMLFFHTYHLRAVQETFFNRFSRSIYTNANTELAFKNIALFDKGNIFQVSICFGI